MTNRQALGRGLAALIPDVDDKKSGQQPETDSEEQSQDAIQFIKVSKISPNPFQPREVFDPDKLAELIASIKEKGVIQPITVRKYQGEYQLIAGERRLRAVTELGFEELPAYILDVSSDEEMMELAIIENIHREDLNPIDIAVGYKRLVEDCHLTQEQVAQKVGKDRATVANFLRLLKLPKRIQESAKYGDITMGHARALLSLNTAEDQLDIWKKIVKSNLSVRQVEANVRKILAGPEEKKEPENNSKITAYLEDAENKLRSKLATKVAIKRKASGGSIEISYFDDDDLDRLISAILNE